MRGHSLSAREIGERRPLGWVSAEDVRAENGARVLRKGQVLDEAALVALEDAGTRRVHLVEPEPGDVHEDQAGRRVAVAVAGPGLRIKGPAQSRYNLLAEHKGLLRVDRDLVRALNRVYGVAAFTLLDRQVVLPGKIVAGVKVTPLMVPEHAVREVERIAAERGPAVRLQPFLPQRVGVLATEGLAERQRERFRSTVESKMAWYGSAVTSVEFLPAEPAPVTAALRRLAAENDLVLVAGGNTIDPLDPAFLALEHTGAEMIHYGAPAHPGSMFWLARLGDTPIFNLASCSMYSRATFADLILPLVLTGSEVTEEEIDDFGYGGLLERDMAFRFPPYEVDSVDEESEAE